MMVELFSFVLGLVIFVTRFMNPFDLIVSNSLLLQYELLSVDTSILKSPAMMEHSLFSIVLQVSSRMVIKFDLLPCGGRYIPNILPFFLPSWKVNPSSSMSSLITEIISLALRLFLIKIETPPPLVFERCTWNPSNSGKANNSLLNLCRCVSVRIMPENLESIVERRFVRSSKCWEILLTLKHRKVDILCSLSSSFSSSGRRWIVGSILALDKAVNSSPGIV